MVDLQKNYDIIWIDHHSKAIKAAMEKNYDPKGIRSTDKAACLLTWEYCFPGQPAPLAYELVDDYDRWQFKYEDTLAFQCGLNTQKTYPVRGDDIWPSFFKDTDGAFIKSIIELGRPIHEYIVARNALVAKDIVFSVHFGHNPIDPESTTGQRKHLKYFIAAANIRGVDSLFFKTIPDLANYDALLIYGYVPAMGKWRYSIYDNGKHIDVGLVAQEHGGNGHEYAAGWTQEDIEICPEVSGVPSFEDPLSELFEKYSRIPVVRKFVLKSDGITINSQMMFGECFGFKAAICNTPYTWPDIWYNVNTVHMQIGIAFVMTNTGRYRLVITNLAGAIVDMTKLAESIGGTLMPTGTIWKYFEKDDWPCYTRYESGLDTNPKYSTEH
jgi:hypothetical protein